MADEFRKILPDKGVIPGETREIKPLSAPFSFSPETIGDDLNSCRPFVNDRLNSRLTQKLPVGDWIIRRSASLEPGLRPKHILHAFDRIIIQGDGPWQLFDKECQSLARGYLPSSEIFLDAANSLFFFSDSAGMIEARNLSDGNRAFSASLLFGNVYYRSFIARRSERMIVVSTEREVDQDAPEEEKPKDSTIEILKFNEPQNVDQDGVLQSSQVVSEVIRKTLLLRSALHDETLVVATTNQICLIDLDLQIETALNGEFTPFTMSLDNAGIIYIVLDDAGIPKLRAITPDGERLFSVELPEKMSNISYPLVIAYNHRVFLIKDHYLMAFAANGRCIWEYKTDSPIAGAVVTADNQLLISSGSQLGVFEANGNYSTLYEFKNESLQTPPTLTASGDLVVATDQKLYCLAIRTN